MTRHLLASAITMLMAAHTVPAVAADIEEGRKIADAWCASCHLTSATGTDTAPQFREIARNRSLSSNSLSRTLAAPHPAMPRLDLSRRQIDDLVAYLRSLNPDNKNGK